MTNLRLVCLAPVAALLACSSNPPLDTDGADAQVASASLGRPTVTLANGYRATGTVADDAGITHYVALPYALPPTPERGRRWTAPVPWTNSGETPADPGDPASPDFDPAGLGAWRLPRCIQGMGGAEGKTGGTLAIPGAVFADSDAGPQSIQSENCLYLNVYTKYANTAAGKPVFVWIHGGANTLGSAMSAIYDPTPHPAPTTVSFMENVDAVVVALNYRMGPFGFLAHPELTAEASTSGTYGSLDQLEALRWVQANISRFGGDPGNVTVFGESAGALDINILSASPLSAGLFKRTIQESVYNFPITWAANFSASMTNSGNVVNSAALQISPFDAAGNPKWPTLADQEHIGTGLHQVLRQPCPPGVVSGHQGSLGDPWGACGYPADSGFSEVRALPAGIIEAAYESSAAAKPAGLGIFSVGPPIDGKLLTAQPLQVLEVASNVAPAIIGTNKDEYTPLLFTFSAALNVCALVDTTGQPCTGGNVANVDLLKADGSGYRRMLQDLFGTSKGAAAFAALPSQYKPKNALNQVNYTGSRAVRDAWVALVTDALFTCHNRRNIRATAKASAGNGASYRYQFTYQPSNLQDTSPLGSARALLSGYVSSGVVPIPWFPQMGASHGLDVGFVMGFNPASSYFTANSGYSPDGDTRVSATFQKSFGQFGSTGTVPSSFATGNASWPPYPTSGAADPALLIDTSARVLDGSLSSQSGNLAGSSGTPLSQCDWLEQFASYL